MGGIARACADESAGDPGGFSKGEGGLSGEETGEEKVMSSAGVFRQEPKNGGGADGHLLLSELNLEMVNNTPYLPFLVTNLGLMVDRDLTLTPT